MKRIALVTYKKQPTLNDSDALVVPQLATRGIEAVATPWDDTAVDWKHFDAAILRSPWDYHTRVDEFRAWLASLTSQSVPVWNDPETVFSNMDKSYLLRLSERGIPIVPTLRVASIDDVALPDDWKRIIIKPIFGASAYGIQHFDRDDIRAWTKHLTTLLKHGAALIQPFLPHIENGEYSLLYFDGVYSHTVKKTPKRGEFRTQPEYGGLEEAVVAPTSALETGAKIMKEFAPPPLYTRIDGVVVDDMFLLMELELIEPYLFLEFDTNAPTAFADAIAKRLH